MTLAEPFLSHLKLHQQMRNQSKDILRNIPLVSDEGSTDLDVDCFGTNSGAALQSEEDEGGVQGDASGFKDNLFMA